MTEKVKDSITEPRSLTEPDSEPPKKRNTSSTNLVPLGVRIASEWSWRLIIISVAAALAFWTLSKLSIVIIPILVALLLSALLMPLVRWLNNKRVPKGISVMVSLVALFGIITGLFSLVGNQFANGYPQLAESAFQGYKEIRDWTASMLLHLHISTSDVNQYVDQGVQQIKSYSGTIASSTLTFGTALGHVAAGFILAIFILIFFLLDGRKIWLWVVGLLPYNARKTTDQAATASWETLSSYVRVQLLIAFFDGVGVAIVAAILKVPLAIPLGVLVFLGAFIPIVGSLLSGMVAVLVALVAHGPITALLMLGGVILVQQVESHVLQPFVVGNTLSLHPVAIVIVVAAGSYLAGITGALFAVPLAAVVNTFVKTVAAKYRDPNNPEAFLKVEEEDTSEITKNIEKLISNIGQRVSAMMPNSKADEEEEKGK
ncbi:MAG: AI-2E family transporter [Micrococcaceae bacterium]